MRSPSGSRITMPSARPRGMIVALWIASEAADWQPPIAWPASW
jgi:hypothetical protein